jgi:uncharacterized membrane protein YeaQ/YmgE (transglycosylase-associated protein family)
METIGVISAGIVVGSVAKWWLAPGGRDDIGVVTTVVCGVLGALIGWYAAAGLGIAIGGVDVIRWTIAILLGSVFAAIMATLTGQSLAGRL